mmetsp:Transcript_8290/g.21260  ORF Transcript_8290/g.21260 Transcript_8290/m.21260 type:complete len:104 (-) Transcript_8290:293-604(-)
MAPASNSLSPMKKFLVMLAFVVLSAVLGVAGAGLLVLMDVDEKRWAITSSSFGTLWLQWNRGNPILQPALFNGAFIGLAMLYMNFIQAPRRVVSAAVQAKKKK